jgi:hypothetical protein
VAFATAAQAQEDVASALAFIRKREQLQRVSLRTRWVTRLTEAVTRILIEQIGLRPSPLCSVLTHEFRGKLCRVYDRRSWPRCHRSSRVG